MPSITKPLIIMISGPYRSGTGDDPLKIAANLHALEEAALGVYRAGHLPIIGEWFALPLSHAAGSTHVGDPIFVEFQYPVAHRLLERCDAVLRIPGKSNGADKDVEIARERGLQVFTRLEDIPVAT
jgi:hypothetical protein